MLVVLPTPNPKEAYLPIEELLSYQYVSEMLGRAGWDRQEIATDLAWITSTRCSSKDFKALGKTPRVACGEFLHRDIDVLTPHVVVLTDYRDWVMFSDLLPKLNGKAPKMNAEAVVNRVITLSNGVRVLTTANAYSGAVSPDAVCGETYVRALDQIHEVLDGTLVEDPFADKDYRLLLEEEEQLAAIAECKASGFFAWDIETKATSGPKAALDPFDDTTRILMFSFSWKDKQAVVIPVMHKDAPQATPAVLSAIYDLFTTTANAAHNGLAYDAQVVQTKLGFTPYISHDTMLAAAEINENQKAGLKPQTFIHCPDLAHYDETLSVVVKANGYDFESVSLVDITNYAAADADATRRLALKQRAHMAQVETPVWGTMLALFDNHRMADARAASEVTMTGALIDEEDALEYHREVTSQMDIIAAQIQGDPSIIAFSNARAAKHMSKGQIFFDGRYLWPSIWADTFGTSAIYDMQEGQELVEGAFKALAEAKIVTARSGKLVKSKVFSTQDIQFIPTNDKHKAELCRDILGARSDRTTKSGGESYNSKFLNSISDKFPVLKLLLKYAKLSKTESTYTRPVRRGFYEHVDARGSSTTKHGWIRDDGMVHASFLMVGREGFNEQDSGGGTATKRKSSANPNLQNVSKHSESGKRVHNLFKSRFAQDGIIVAVDDAHERALLVGDPDKGKAPILSPAIRNRVKKVIRPGEAGSGALINLDFSQLELRGYAVVANSDWMLNQYQMGKDLHGELACEIFGKSMEEVQGKLRTYAKKSWFGPIYQAQTETVHQGMVDDGVESPTNPGQPISLMEVQDILAGLYAKIPEYDEFKDGIIREAESNLMVVSDWTGSRRHLPHLASPDRKTQSYARRQAVNFVLQNLGAEVTAAALYRIAAAIAPFREHCVLWNTVHDSFCLDVKSEFIPYFSAIAKGIMEDPILPRLRRGVCPIEFKADVEVGPAWGGVADFNIEAIRPS